MVSIPGRYHWTNIEEIRIGIEDEIETAEALEKAKSEIPDECTEFQVALEVTHGHQTLTIEYIKP